MFNFNGTYLNGELEGDKEIYMQQPPGYETGSAECVMKLLKALYGLKQAGRRWYDVVTGQLAGGQENHQGEGMSALDPQDW